MTSNYTDNFHICADDRLSLLFSFSVHAGAFGTFLSLLTGAGLYSLDIKTQGFAGLPDWLAQNQITVYCSVPAGFRQFTSILTGEERFPNLRLIYLAGEPVYRSDAEQYRKHLPHDFIFVNRLGCTEADVISMYFIDKNTWVSGNTVQCGFGPQDKQVLVLDEEGSEVGINQTGEIAVRSRYLSPGYWKRPDLTKANFLPDPDSGDQRIYLTGDLGQMRPDGCPEHLGRKDFQLKIRGYRVEAAEVEMALFERTDVQEAVAVAREDLPGNHRLFAYVVPASQPAPSIASLRSSLQEKLPEYMVPSAFVFLDALPTLPNGKLNRRELPPPLSARPELGTPLVGGRTPVERALLEIWSAVLGLDEVGVHDNFLELGGDSLLSGQVVARVIGEFRVDLPLRSLFQAPTVADMALAITQRRAKAADQADINRMLTELEALLAKKAKTMMDEDGSTDVYSDGEGRN